MRNISFDNPLWLLIAIPLFAAVLAPFFLAIRKDNKSKSVIASLVLHLVIVVCVALAAAGFSVTTVITETQVLVVADVSYSSRNELDTVDEYVAAVKEELPLNSKMGVICFGRNQVLHAPLGAEEIPSVKEADVDGSVTDISSALKYAASLFDEGVVKRIVLITDGAQTDGSSAGDLINTIDTLASQDIYIDAMYVDANLKDDATEVQISAVDAMEKTYLNHESVADILIQSGCDTNAVVTLYANAAKVVETAVSLSKGYNIVNLDLQTETAGTFDYEIVVHAEEDGSDKNNSFCFTQSVTDELKVLFISPNRADYEAALALYGDRADIDEYIVTSKKNDVPCSVEELCKYDEIMLSNLDVRALANCKAFIDSLDKAVSLFGKSLVVTGDTKIQNKDDTDLEQLEDMLPIKYGNGAQDPKLYGIVIDSSRSMFSASRLEMAKQAAIYLLNILSDDDYVCVVTFAGGVTVLQTPTTAANRNEIAKKINEIAPIQGTYLAAGLDAAYDLIKNQPFTERQVMLISDGMTYTAEPGDGVVYAREVNEQYGVVTSVINTYNNYDDAGSNLLSGIAEAGKGNYYYLKSDSALEELMFSQVADNVTETVIETETDVNIDRPNDGVLAGIDALPPVLGFVNSKEKSGAVTPLTVDYVKADGTVAKVPLYSYWEYGNGQVSCFTSTVGGDWLASWQGGTDALFLGNVLTENIPEEKIDYAYTLSVGQENSYAFIEIVPATVDPFASVSVRIVYPDGSEKTDTLAFDSFGYSYEFAALALGKYTVFITYESNGRTFTSESSFHLSYLPEYNAFTVFDASTLNAAVRHRGRVTEDGTVTLANDENELSTYKLSFATALLIAAVAGFVVDIIVRKIKWDDIRSLFKKRSGGKKV